MTEQRYLSTGAVVVQVHEWPRILFNLASIEKDSRESKSVADVGTAASPPEDASRRPCVTIATAAGFDAVVPSTAADSRTNADDVGQGLVTAAADEVTQATSLRHGVRDRCWSYGVSIRHFLRASSCHTSSR